MSDIRWYEQTMNKLKSLKSFHELQRISLELNLETTPKDSKYSSLLIDLMRKEEQMLKELHHTNNTSITNLNKVVEKVDEHLKLETRKFFSRNALQNINRWNTLQDKFQKERNQLKLEISNYISNKGSTELLNNIKTISIKNKNEKNGKVSSDDIEAEAERLELDYNRNWLKYEYFNLQEAFKSQSDKIENDWSNHEKTLEIDFKIRREKVTGVSIDSHESHVQQTGNDQRWQHPEKQKTLIHTAPVFTPNKVFTEMNDSNGSTGKKRKDSNLVAIQLEGLERDYRSTLTSYQKQKEDAKRWLRRQQLRLTTQAYEVQREKAAVADIIESELEDFQILTETLSAIRNYAAKQELSTNSVNYGSENRGSSSSYKLSSQRR